MAQGTLTLFEKFSDYIADGSHDLDNDSFKIMLITEAAHLSDTHVFGNSVGAIPKGYLYFAITFSLFVEFLNYRITKKSKNIKTK